MNAQTAGSMHASGYGHGDWDDKTAMRALCLIGVVSRLPQQRCVERHALLGVSCTFCAKLHRD